MTAPDSPFCADRSIRSREWTERELPFLVPPAGVDVTAARIAAARGAEDLAGHFVPSFRSAMPDPSTIKGMDEAVERMHRAVRDGEGIAILGDYDVDGASSTAMLVRMLRNFGHSGHLSWSIPDRMVDGYGPNDRLVEEMHEGGKVSVLVLADSGTASIGPIAHARSLGMDVIVLDHHEPQASLPDAIVVNPKCQDGRNYDYLCTAGIAFLFGVAMQRRLRQDDPQAVFPDLRGLLGLVALATVADVVPLIGLNRAYVSLGLLRIPEIQGLATLAEVAGESNLTVHACAFVLAPCINAAGRIGRMHTGVRLLLTTDTEEAHELATELHRINDERRTIQKSALEAAIAMVDTTAKGIVLHDPSWHPGVVGLVASKLREIYDRPAIVIGEAGKGSARTVEGFDIGATVIDATAAGLLLKGGGHKAAAGLTLDPSRFEEFKAFVLGRLDGFDHPSFTADLVVPCGSLTIDTALGFESLAPFGQGNPKPRIAVVGGVCVRTQIMKALHVKIVLDGPGGIMEAIAFNAVETPIGKAMLSSQGRKIDLYGPVEVSEWAGVRSVVMKPEDVMLGPDRASAAA